jgi:hypothetical protein
MGLPTRSLPVPANEPDIPTSQLLLAGIVMPLGFAVANQYLLNFQWEHPPDGPGTAILWLLFVSQVGVVSSVAAHLVQKSWHGWAVYAWCCLLIDLQVLWASSHALGSGVQTESLLLTALLAAQLGLVVVWSILGEQKWTIRVPVLLGLAVGVTLLLRQQMGGYYHGLSYSVLFLMQILGLYAVCSLLRCRGLCLSRPGEGPRERSMPDWQFPAFRFGLREFAVVAALFAVILVAVQYSVYGDPPRESTPVNLAFAAVLTALTVAVAVWSALGAAPIEVRITGLLATCVLTASGFIISDALFGDRYHQFVWSEAFASRGWIFAWMYLAGGLLSATLLMMRMLGYRLRRVVTAEIGAEDLKRVAGRLPTGAYALLAKGR